MKLLIMKQLQRQLDKLCKKYAFAWFLCQWEDLECLVYFPLRTLHRCTQIHFPSLALKELPLSLLVVCHSVFFHSWPSRLSVIVCLSPSLCYLSATLSVFLRAWPSPLSVCYSLCKLLSVLAVCHCVCLLPCMPSPSHCLRCWLYAHNV